MRRPVGYGIDFGTTNSSVAIGYDDGSVEVVDIDERSVQPQSLRSLVYIDRNGQRVPGAKAVSSYQITGARRTQCNRCPLVSYDNDGEPITRCRTFRPSDSCADSRILADLKSDLADRRFKSTHSWAEDFELVELIAVVIGELKRRADRIAGESIDCVVLGHPVAFVGAETGDGHVDTVLQDAALRRLDKAARLAGFVDVAMMPEPAAVVQSEPLPEGYTLSVDFGGGTFDVAVLETVEGAPETVAVAGTPIGGSAFDAAVFDLAVAEQLRLFDEIEDQRRIDRFPAAMKSEMRTLAGALRLTADPQIPFTLRYLKAAGIDTSAVSPLLLGGLAFEFYAAIEQAKIDLSDADEARIHFVRRGALAVIEDVTREALERETLPLLDRIEQTIDDALGGAGLSRSDIDLVIRTGGSSMIPSFVRMLDHAFPEAGVRARAAFTSVASGLAAVAAAECGHDSGTRRGLGLRRVGPDTNKPVTSRGSLALPENPAVRAKLELAIQKGHSFGAVERRMGGTQAWTCLRCGRTVQLVFEQSEGAPPGMGNWTIKADAAGFACSG